MNIRGIVDFPLAGKGIVIHFPVSALLVLEKEYGAGDAWVTIETRIMNASAEVTAKCLSVGLRRLDGEKTRPVDLDMDDWDFTIQDAAVPILDALCLAYFGTDYAEQISLAQARNAAEDLANLKTMLEGGSDAADPFTVSPEPNE